MDKGSAGMSRFIWPSGADSLEAYLASLAPGEAFTVTVEPYKKRLPSNLRSRIKILVRELGVFNGVCYEEMNGIVHRLYYPKRDRVIAGQTIESSIPTNELTPDEARIIESELINLGAAIGCPLFDPHQK